MRPLPRRWLLFAAALLILPFAGRAESAPPPQGIPYRVHTRIGFKTDQILTREYRKFGRAFGRITKEEYLRMAQDLRDRPLDMKILEGVRRDGVITRFDRKTKGYIAFQRNLVILTFFRPPEGEKYFHNRLRSARRR